MGIDISLLVTGVGRQAVIIGWLGCAATLLRQRPKPIVHVAARLVLSNAVAFLNFPFQLFALALDNVKIVIGELAPLLLNTTAELLPIARDAIPIHGYASLLNTSLC